MERLRIAAMLEVFGAGGTVIATYLLLGIAAAVFAASVWLLIFAFVLQREPRR